MKLFVGAKAIIVQGEKVLVLREAQYDEGTNEGKWDVPGGRIHPEEKILEGLAREVKEECGLTVEPEEVLGVAETFPMIKGENCHIVRIYYRCRVVGGDVVLSNDHDMYEWVERDGGETRLYVSDIEEMIQKGLKK